MRVDGQEVEFCSFRKFEQGCNLLTSKLAGYEFDGLYAVPRGGLAVGLRLSHLMDLPMREKSNVADDTLIIDDISDTGKTLKPYQENPIATLYYRKGSQVVPDVWAFEKTDKWVVYWWELRQ